MNRKQLTNKDKFVFNECEIVPPLSTRVRSSRLSAQKRLAPKAECNKPPFNPPTPSPGSSRNGDWRGPAGNYGVKKQCSVTDPCVEEVVAKLAKFNVESPPTNRQEVAPMSISKEVFDPFKSYHNGMSSWHTPSKPIQKFMTSSPLTPPFSPYAETEKLKIEKKEENNCVCTRPPKLILCPVCSHTMTGRIRKTCQVHPKEVYLLDIEACSRCKETKFVLKEYDLPDGFTPAVELSF